MLRSLLIIKMANQHRVFLFLNLYCKVDDFNFKARCLVRLCNMTVNIRGNHDKPHCILQYANHSCLSFIQQDVSLVFVWQIIVSLKG